MDGNRSTVLNDPKPSTRPLELLVHTGLMLSQERDLRNIVQAATDAGREISAAQFGAFFYNVIDASGESYLLYTISGVAREEFSKFPMPRNTEVFAATFAGQGVVRSGDITQDPRYGHNAPHRGMPEGHLPVRSYLAVPVISRSGEVLGGLLYGHSDRDVFREESEDLVQTIAAQAAVAIENFRLHEQLMRQVQEVRNAQQQQQRDAHRVTEILESTSDAVFLLDREWSFQYLNRHAIDLIAEGRELFGRNIWELFPAAIGSVFEREYTRAMKDRCPCEFVEFFPPLNAWYAVRAYPAQDGIAVFFRDVTREREAERTRQENARRLRIALQAGELGTWTWNPESDVIDLDERAAAIYGIEPHAPLTRRYMREHLILAEDQRIAEEALRLSLEKGSAYVAEYRVLRSDQSVAWVLAHGAPLHDGDHPEVLTGMIGTIQDITARRNQEEALRQTEKLAATGRMAATIAHEINNPLEAVGNLIYLARTNPEAPLAIRQQLQIADEELRRVSQIAQQTLGFYRETVQPASFDLAAAARETVAIFHRRLLAHQVACRMDIPAHFPFLGLQGEMRQAISNLLVNAIDASPSPGEITLRIRSGCMPRTGQRAVSILICDGGAGIPPEVRRSLFAPFFTTKREIGTGLGLWVTRGIVEKQGGSIRFRSRTQGATGTVFRILMPNAEVSPAT